MYGDDDGKDEEEVAVYEAEEEHDRRSINCRFAQAVFTTIMAAALLALGKYADKMANNKHFEPVVVFISTSYSQCC